MHPWKAHGTPEDDPWTIRGRGPTSIFLYPYTHFVSPIYRLTSPYPYSEGFLVSFRQPMGVPWA